MRHGADRIARRLGAALCSACLLAPAAAGGAASPADAAAGEAGGGSAFRFAVLGDSQPHSAFAKPNEIYGAILDQINALDVDFTINVGDVVAGYCAPATFRRQLVDFMESSKRLKAPYHIAFGNHDMSLPESEAVLKEMLGRPPYTAFTHKGALFILLNSSMSGRTAALDELQRKWLAGELARNAGAKPIFVFIHHPVFPWQAWPDNMTREETENLHGLFRRYGVAAVFCGHQHYYRLEEHDGIRYYITGGGGGPLFTASDQSFYHFLLVTVRDGKFRVDLRRPEEDPRAIFNGGVEMESPMFLEPIGCGARPGVSGLKSCRPERSAPGPAWNLFEEGLRLQDGGDANAAIEKYRAAAAADPALRAATHNMAVLYGQKGMLRGAESLLVGLLREPGPPGETRYNLAFILAAEGRIAAARGVLEEGLAERPDDPWCRAGMGLMRAYMGEYDAAARDFEIAAAGAPRIPLPRREMAAVLLSRGECDRAISECRAALAGDPSDREALNLMAEAFARKGEIRSAVDCYDRLLAAEPGNVAARVQKGNLLMRMKAYGDAREEYRKALSVKGDSVPALYNCTLAGIRESMKSWEESPPLYGQKVFQNIEETLPQFNSLLSMGLEGRLRARVLNNLAATLYLGGLGESLAIEEYLKQAIAADPGAPEPHVNLGNLRWEGKQTGLAGLSYLKALKIDPACSAARYNLATLLVLDGKIEEGIGVYKELLARDPSYWRAWNSLAEVYMHRRGTSPATPDDLALALAAWRKSLALNPPQGLPQQMIGKIMEEQPRIAGTPRPH